MSPFAFAGEQRILREILLKTERVTLILEDNATVRSVVAQNLWEAARVIQADPVLDGFSTDKEHRAANWGGNVRYRTHVAVPNLNIVLLSGLDLDIMDPYGFSIIHTRSIFVCESAFNAAYDDDLATARTTRRSTQRNKAA
jgi:hypothetical protein